MKFKDFLIARRRGVILFALDETANDVQVAADLLHSYCVAVGLSPTREAIDRDIAWLAERHLVESGEQQGLLMAVITQEGREVVAQRVKVPGVSVAEVAEF